MSESGAVVSRREFGQTPAAALSISLEPAGASARAKAAESGLFYSSAIDLAARLRKKNLSARDVMAAHSARIEQVNPRVNAIVTRIRAAGAITLGRTNTPEFGSASQTFNTVFGSTRNPAAFCDVVGFRPSPGYGQRRPAP